MRSELNTRLERLAKRMDEIKTDLPKDVTSNPPSPCRDIAEEFLGSKHELQKRALNQKYSLFNESAPEDDFKRVKAAMDFVEEHVHEFAKIIEVNPNSAMKKKIAMNLYDYNSSAPRALSEQQLSDLIEVFISISKGERKFNCDKSSPTQSADIDKVQHKHSRIGTWNLARQKALGKQ